MDRKDLRIIRNLYWEQMAVIRPQEGNSEEFSIEKAVTQGWVLSPKLFNMCAESVFREIEDFPGILIRVENVNNFRCADDTAVIADTEERLQEIVKVAREPSEELGLSMNVSQTKMVRVN